MKMRLTSHTGLLFLAALLGGCAAHQGACPVAGHGSGATPLYRSIQVVGSGEVQVEPDVARTSLGVEASAQTARAAADAVNTQVAKVIDALKKAGVAREDLQTHNLSLYYERFQEPRPMPAAEGAEKPDKPRGQYRARNTLEVTLRDLDAAPSVIAAATAAGANEMHGLNFDVDDRAPHVREAREKAMRAAQADAAQLAELNGAELGRVVAVYDGTGHSGPGVPMMAMRESAQSSDAAPIERGKLTIRHTVTLVVEVEQ